MLELNEKDEKEEFKVQEKINDCLVISDIHLGSDVCQAKLLSDFLEEIHSGNLSTEHLILNGDLFEDSNFHRLKKKHWQVLSLIRKLSKQIHVIHIIGNHELPTDLMSLLLGVEVVEEYALWSGGRHILFHHGHRFDTFIDNHPFLTWLADCLYWALQKIDRSFSLARRAKQASKTFLRNSEIIEKKSLEYAEKHGYHAVCTGHTHLAVAKSKGIVGYYNSGCWTELPCTYLAIKDGNIQLNNYS